MARVSVKEFRANPTGGEIIVTLQSLNGMPIEGVMTTLGRKPVQPSPKADPTMVSWRLPVTDERYVLYGIIIPLRRMMRAPLYARTVTQGDAPCPSRAKNPERFKTRKVSQNEWVGPPEVIRTRIR